MYPPYDQPFLSQKDPASAIYTPRETMIRRLTKAVSSHGMDGVVNAHRRAPRAAPTRFTMQMSPDFA
jgi:hypothetical protein